MNGCSRSPRSSTARPVRRPSIVPRARVRAVERAESAHHRGRHAATVADDRGRAPDALLTVRASSRRPQAKPALHAAGRGIPAISKAMPIPRTSCRSERRPVRRAPSSAPGTEAPAPTASSSQSGARTGRWPRRPAAPTRTPTARFVPTARVGVSPTSLSRAGIRSAPRMRPTKPPSSPMIAPEITAARMSSGRVGEVRRLGGAAPAQQVGAARRGARPRSRAGGPSPGRRRRGSRRARHRPRRAGPSSANSLQLIRPARMCTADAVAAATARSRCWRRHPPPPTRRRATTTRQADVAEHEPDEAAHDGDREGPQPEEDEVDRASVQTRLLVPTRPVDDSSPPGHHTVAQPREALRHTRRERSPAGRWADDRQDATAALRAPRPHDLERRRARRCASSSISTASHGFDVLVVTDHVLRERRPVAGSRTRAAPGSTRRNHAAYLDAIAGRGRAGPGALRPPRRTRARADLQRPGSRLAGARRRDRPALVRLDGPAASPRRWRARARQGAAIVAAHPHGDDAELRPERTTRRFWREWRLLGGLIDRFELFNQREVFGWVANAGLPSIASRRLPPARAPLHLEDAAPVREVRGGGRRLPALVPPCLHHAARARPVAPPDRAAA